MALTASSHGFRASAAPRRYLVYGTRIASDIELWPGERAAPEAAWQADIRVECLRSEALPAANSAHLAAFDWPGLARILVEGGQQISVSVAPEADGRELAAAVAGPALAAVLGQRGNLALHGTCVAFGNSATCLLGESGAGKSTLAAALCAVGGALVSDTMTIVDPSSSRATVAVGPAQFKLWPDAARALGRNPDEFARALPDCDKRVCPFFGAMAPPLVRLDRVFVLLPGGPVVAEPMRPAAAAVALLQNHFLAGYLEPNQRNEWLSACARVAASTRVCSLRRGLSLTDLSEAVRLVRS